MNSEIKFEIIIITYNQQDTIERAIKSVICQTLLPCKISIYDDCSTDGTVSIICAMMERAKVPFDLNVNNQNLGIFANWNQTVDNAVGDVICVLAGDDEYELDLLENTSNFIIEHHLDLSSLFWIIPNLTKVYSDGKMERVNNHTLDNKSIFELIIVGKLLSFEVGLSLPAFKQSYIRTDIGYQADNLKSLLLVKNSNVFLADYWGYRYSVNTGVTTKTKKNDYLKSRIVMLNLLLDNYSFLLSSREILFVKYELAKAIEAFKGGIKNILSLYYLSLKILIISNSIYSCRSIVHSLVPTFLKSKVKSFYCKNE